MSDLNLEYDSIIKEVITPIFKNFGFKKIGNNFYRDFGETGQAFNIQKSKWNSKDEKDFVFNLGLIDKSIYKEVNGIEVTKFPKEVDCEIRVRLGYLTDVTNEWYKLNSNTELPELKSKIKNDITKYVIPFFENFRNPENWLEIFEWKNEPYTYPLSKFLIIKKYGNTEEAVNFLNKVYNEAISKYRNGETDRINKEIGLNWIEKIQDLARKKSVELRIKHPIELKKDQTNIWQKIKENWFSKIKH
ncbi:protein of unknown function [Salinimicrobium catena]|uniref:DUF4304 domain-containing protein n=1 Tax=Salinimicrobium catena TaxID=390640 RepID=A0A1H5PJZ3_9FLAO|nr:DUF4304 domain-containing protein [Salinimicrobium catena]SDL86653.1 protein of unknown function [Salinimicrobium catena]SEF13347.1 protein of unknown function [Salinimicrobium catena]